MTDKPDSNWSNSNPELWVLHSFGRGLSTTANHLYFLLSTRPISPFDIRMKYFKYFVIQNHKNYENDAFTLMGFSPKPIAFDIEAKAACISDSFENFTNPNPLLSP